MGNGSYLCSDYERSLSVLYRQPFWLKILAQAVHFVSPSLPRQVASCRARLVLVVSAQLAAVCLARTGHPERWHPPKVKATSLAAFIVC